MRVGQSSKKLHISASLNEKLALLANFAEVFVAEVTAFGKNLSHIHAHNYFSWTPSCTVTYKVVVCANGCLVHLATALPLKAPLYACYELMLLCS